MITAARTELRRGYSEDESTSFWGNAALPACHAETKRVLIRGKT